MSNKENLANLLINRELTYEERKKRLKEIENFMIEKGGIIIALSCQDGILLVGSSPNEDQTIFPVFHRISLLGVGRPKDCRDVHELALRLALGTELAFSKADISVEAIAHNLIQEIEKAFNYIQSPRGLYKANFIIAELGFEMEEDYMGLVLFSGGNKLTGVSCGDEWKIYESPLVIDTILLEPDETQKGDNESNESKQGNGKKKKQEKETDESKNENDQPKKIKAKIKRHYSVPVYESLKGLADSIYSQDKIWSVREAAFFAGIALSFFDARQGELEMVYLDRNMLRKTKSGGRRFHDIWRRITNPNPYYASDPWEDWKKFVAPISRRVKKREIYPDFKEVIELLEILEKGNAKGISEKEQEIIQKISGEHKTDLFKKIFNK